MPDIAQSRWKGIKVKSQLSLFLLAGLLAAVIGSGCKSSSEASPSSGKDSHGPQIKSVMHLEPFVVNLADPEENRFLRAGIDLGLEKALPSKEGKGGEGEIPLSRIRDCILAVLSTWRSDALLAPEGKEKLKQELVRALGARVPELGVKEIYFTDFLVQR